MRKNTRLAIRRNCGFALSCCIMALGIALVTNSGIGTTPISSLPFVCSAILGVTLGAATFAINIIFIAGQKILLGKNFTRFHLLQIPGVIIFSFCINLWMYLTAPLISNCYFLQLLMVFAGSAILGFGISLELISKATVQPGEGILIAIAFRTHMDFSRLKIIFDVTLVGLAALLSWLVLGQIVGLREGTLISALFTGPCVRLTSRFTCYLGPYFHGHRILRVKNKRVLTL